MQELVVDGITRARGTTAICAYLGAPQADEMAEVEVRVDDEACEAVIRALASRPRPAVRRLRVALAEVEDPGVLRALAGSLPHLERLELRLDAGRGEYGADLILELGLEGYPALRELDLRGSTFGNLRADHPHATPLRAIAASPIAARLAWLGLPAIDDEDRTRIAEIARALPALAELHLDAIASAVEPEARRAFRALVVAPRAVAAERPGAIDSIAFSPDGALIVTGGDATIWDARTLAPRTRLGSGRGRAAFARDGRVVAAIVDSSVRLFDPEGAPVATLTGPCDVVDFAWARDGALVVGTDHEVALWQVGDREPRWRIDVGDIWASSPLVSADGKWIACGLRGKQIAIIDRERAVVDHLVGGAPGPRGATSWLHAVPMPERGAAIGWRIAGAAIQPVVVHVPGARSGPLGGTIHSISRDGSTIALVRPPRGRNAGKAEHIELYDAATGAPRQSISLAGASVAVLAWSQDGHQIATGADGAIALWQVPR